MPVWVLALVAASVAQAHEYGPGWAQASKPNSPTASLVPPGQVMLRWDPVSPPPSSDPNLQWKFKRIRLLAYDKSTKRATNFSVFDGSQSNEGVRELVRVQVGPKAIDEYRFPKYSLDAGYYSFQLSACFWQPESFPQPEKCTDWSAPSNPQLPVPGDTIDKYQGDKSATGPQPGIPQWVKAELKGTGDSAVVVVKWGDPHPARATSFVVLANPDNITSTKTRFAVSQRLYENLREFAVPIRTLSKTCAKAAQEEHGDCLFTFQVAAIDVNVHGVPSRESNAVLLPLFAGHKLLPPPVHVHDAPQPVPSRRRFCGTTTPAVTTVNSRGGGPWSPVRTVTAGVQHPSAPSRPLKITDGLWGNQITIRWGKPEEDGGSAIDKYRVVAHKTKMWMNPDFTQSSFEQEEAIERDVGWASQYTMKGLEPGSSYMFRVAAHNQAGWSSLSESSELLSTAAEPEATSADEWTRVQTTQLMCILAVACVSAVLWMTLCTSSQGHSTQQGPDAKAPSYVVVANTDKLSALTTTYSDAIPTKTIP
eukprot:TRINITY_DN2036_c0_g1_i8.p1 TRINITY_DN2036_c0_g1~~TRINITY_DN2036_c0_g1_i8.p1  ORF type:complete len:535 (+),score=91.91 TRINITY_DN2036_c0_g1_i8:209-1813(+)